MFRAFLPENAKRPLVLAVAAVATLGGLVAPAAAFTGEPGRPTVSRPATVLVDEATGRYGVNAHPDHPGHAGIHDCGPGSKPTGLSRRSCGGIDRFGHLRD